MVDMSSDDQMVYRMMLLALRSHLRGEVNVLVELALDVMIRRRPARPQGICRSCRRIWRTGFVRAFKDYMERAIVRQEKLIDRIEDALLRLDDGSYGTCTLCKSPINNAWLTAVPYIDRCVECDSQRVLRN
jgi:hypothetical protein